MQCKFLPMALLRRTAATVESTPPDIPKITFSLPTVFFIFEMVILEKESGVQFGLIFEILQPNCLFQQLILMATRFQ